MSEHETRRTSSSPRGRRNERSTVVCALLDAFRWDFLDPLDSPWLWGMAERGLHVERLVSTSGFTQRSTLFTGTYPDTRDQYTMYCFNPDGSPYASLGRSRQLTAVRALRSWRRLPEARGIARMKRMIGRRCSAFEDRIAARAQEEAHKIAHYMPRSNIPIECLPFLDSVEDRHPIHEPGSSSIQTIFDVGREHDLRIEYVMFPEVVNDDDAVLERMLERLDGDVDLYLLTFADVDKECHVHGTAGSRRRQVVGEIDRKFRVLSAALDDVYDRIGWLVFGDHGMSDIQKTIDAGVLIQQHGERHGLRNGRDYLVFLDSTLVRLWSLADSSRRFVRNCFRELEEFGQLGVAVDPEIATRYRIPAPSEKYGHAVWWANPGVLVYPDYFQKGEQCFKGMHGYCSDNEDMWGLAIIQSPEVEAMRVPTANLVDLCPTLCQMLGVPSPSSSEGTSLLAAQVGERR